MNFNSVHYQNILQVRITPCHIYKFERRSFQNQVPITAELREIFREHRVFMYLHTLKMSSCNQKVVKKKRKRYSLFVLHRLARFLSVSMKTRAIPRFNAVRRLLNYTQLFKIDRPQSFR